MSKTTPCDYGNCPYDAEYSEHCRVHCGLGVDEDEYPEEEYSNSFDYQDDDNAEGIHSRYGY